MSELTNKHPDFAERLNEMMDLRGVDKVRLHELTGIAYEMIRRYCEGLAKPRDKNLQLISDVLSASASYLSFGSLPKEALDSDSASQPTDTVLIGSPSKYPPVPITYMDIKASCGVGYINDDHPATTSQYFTVEFLRENDLPIDGVGVVLMHACNDSMGYTIPSKSMMMVNTNDRTFDNFVNDKVYVFNVNGEMICKRAIKNLDGSILLKSDNTDKTLYPDQIITRDTFEQFDLFGRVHWVSKKI